MRNWSDHDDEFVTPQKFSGQVFESVPRWAVLLCIVCILLMMLIDGPR